MVNKEDLREEEEVARCSLQQTADCLYDVKYFTCNLIFSVVKSTFLLQSLRRKAGLCGGSYCGEVEERTVTLILCGKKWKYRMSHLRVKWHGIWFQEEFEIKGHIWKYWRGVGFLHKEWFRMNLMIKWWSLIPKGQETQRLYPLLKILMATMMLVMQCKGSPHYTCAHTCTQMHTHKKTHPHTYTQT